MRRISIASISICFLAYPFGASRCAAAAEEFALELKVLPLSLELSVPQNSAVYYQLDSSTNLDAFKGLSMGLGRSGATWRIPLSLSSPRVFFRARRHSVYSIRDSDLDGMDDVWELEHGLDPLNPADALHAWGRDGLTNLQAYQRLFGRQIPDNETIGREISLFNFGAPNASLEAVSREVSLWNFGEPGARVEAYSREVSLYQGEKVPTAGYDDAISRELTVWNFGAPPVRIEAMSRELSIFNGEREASPLFREAISHELSIFNSGAPGPLFESISREVTVYNNIAGALM